MDSLNREFLMTRLDGSFFTVRAYNSLTRQAVIYNGDIAVRTEEEMVDVRQFGRQGMDQLRRYIDAKGLTLRPPKQSFAWRLRYLYGGIRQAPVSSISLVAPIAATSIFSLAKRGVFLVNDLLLVTHSQLEDFVGEYLATEIVQGLHLYLNLK